MPLQAVKTPLGDPIVPHPGVWLVGVATSAKVLVAPTWSQLSGAIPAARSVSVVAPAGDPTAHSAVVAISAKMERLLLAIFRAVFRGNEQIMGNPFLLAAAVRRSLGR
jgi:hypothetical protein